MRLASRLSSICIVPCLLIACSGPVEPEDLGGSSSDDATDLVPGVYQGSSGTLTIEDPREGSFTFELFLTGATGQIALIEEGSAAVTGKLAHFDDGSGQCSLDFDLSKPGQIAVFQGGDCTEFRGVGAPTFNGVFTFEGLPVTAGDYEGSKGTLTIDLVSATSFTFDVFLTGDGGAISLIEEGTAQVTGSFAHFDTGSGQCVLDFDLSKPGQIAVFQGGDCTELRGVGAPTFNGVFTFEGMPVMVADYEGPKGTLTVGTVSRTSFDFEIFLTGDSGQIAIIEEATAAVDGAAARFDGNSNDCALDFDLSKRSRIEIVQSGECTEFRGVGAPSFNGIYELR